MRIHRFRPTHRKNSLFLKVLIIVGIVQAALLVGLAGVLVTQSIIPQEQTFESAPKPVQTQEPEQVKRRVITKNLQKRSNQMPRRINVAKVQNIQTPEVTISLPSGMGGDVGGGFDVTNIGSLSLDKIQIDLPTMDLFGLKAKAEKVLIAFDVGSRSMTDDMGGLDAFNVVRNEISTLVRGLPSTALFNMMCFDNERWYEDLPCAINLFRSSLVPANDTNKRAFTTWLNQFNRTPNDIGIREPNYSFRTNPVPFNHGFSYDRDVWECHMVVSFYLAYQAAIEQGADVIFMLTTHWPKPEEFFVKMTDAQLKKYLEETKENAEKFVKSGGILVSKEEKEKYYRIAREHARKLIDAENEQRKAQGKPLKVVRDPWGEAWRLRTPQALEAVKRKSEEDMHPRFKFKTYRQGTLLAAYEPMFKKVYDSRGIKRPTLNMIVMLPKKEDGSFNKNYGSSTRSWAKANGGGSVRILRGAKPVSEY